MFKIITDSTCDLDKDLLEKYDISIAPLSITINDKTYLDRIDITADYLFSILEGLDKSPATAAPSPIMFYNLIEEAVEKNHKQILIITMSSGTSASYKSACIAKQMYDEKDNEIELDVIDSYSMSHGSGYLILKIARLRELGMSYKDAINFATRFKQKVVHLLSVDDLDNLIRSGRLSNASAFIGKLLRIKPIMSMKGKKGAIVAKTRGIKGVLNYYINSFKEHCDISMTDFIIIGYTSDKAYALNLKTKLLNETNYKGEIFIMQMGVSVGVHVGLGGLSMYYIKNEESLDAIITGEIEKIKNNINKLKNNFVNK